jgi:hypothetical protein
MAPDESEDEAIEGPDVPMPDVQADPATGKLPDGWEWEDEEEA